MVDIPEPLARSIQSGDCVLWLGAGFGALAGRSGWPALLASLIPDCDEEVREALEALLDQRRLAPMAGHVRRHLGEARLREALRAEAPAGAPDPQFGDTLEALRRLPWRSCWTSVHIDLASTVLTQGSTKPLVVNGLDAHDVSFEDSAAPFVLDIPLVGAGLRNDRGLMDLIEEALRSRTILWLGFHPEDPDFCELLALVEAIDHGREHFAVLSGITSPEAEDLHERFGIRVIALDEDDAFNHVVAQLAAECQRLPRAPSAANDALAVLDLVRAVGHLPERADQALDESLMIDGARVAALIERVSAQLDGVPTATVLGAGHVMLAQARLELARICYDVVARRGEPSASVARFNLGLVALSDGDRGPATQALRAAGATRPLAIVPPEYELLHVHRRSGTQLFLTCLARDLGREVDIIASPLRRPVGLDERIGFKAAVKQLAKVQHPGMCRVLTGFARGRMFGVVYEATPGFVLSESISDGALPMSFGKTWELLEPLLGALKECHARNLLHRNINPDNVVVGAAGAKLRGFGFPPVVGFTRPSVMFVNRGYLAPEVRDGDGERPASDVYAIAALAYRLLSGRVPQGSVPFVDIENEDVDPRIDPLLRRALHPDPAQRLDLDSLIEGLTEIAAEQEQGVMLREADAPEARSERTSGRHSTLKYALPDDPEDLESWAWILEHKSTHLEARQNIERIEAEARETGRWDRVVEALTIKANVTQIQQDRVAHLREAAFLFENKLAAPANAFGVLEELLAELSTPEQVALVDDFHRLSRVTGRWSDLSDILEGLAPRVADEHPRAALLCLRGRILAEHLHEREAAISAYEAAISIAPTRELWEAMVPLYRQTEDAPGLARALVSLADLQDGPERIATLLEAARVFHQQMADDDGALGAVEIALAEVPEHGEALALAEDLSRGIGRWDLVVEYLTRRARLEPVPKAASSLRKEAAEIALLRLSDESAAIGLFQDIVRADPDDREALTQLTALLREGATFDPKLRSHLIDALEGLLRLLTEDGERAATVVELIGLLDLDAPERALEYRKRLLDLLPMEREVCREAAALVEHHYVETGDLGALESLLRREAECEPAEAKFRIAAWSKLLGLYKKDLVDDAKALEALEHLSKLEPEEGQWQGQLASRYMEGGKLEQAVSILETQIAAATADGPKAVLLLQAGRVHRSLGDLEEAIESWERAIDLEPELTEAWIELEPAYDARSESAKAVDASIRVARLTDDDDVRVRKLFDAAVRSQALGLRAQATALLEDVLKDASDRHDARRMLLELYMDAQNVQRAWPHAVLHLEWIEGQPEVSSQERLKALAWAGRCALAVEDVDRARAYIEQAKKLDAANLDLVRLLSELDLRSGRYREALRGFQTLSSDGTITGPSALASLNVQMARARIGLGEHVKAFQLLERAVEIDPDHREAAMLWVEVAPHLESAAHLRAIEHRLALLGRREQNTDDISELAEIQDARRELLETAGGLYRELGRVEDCVRALESLSGFDPDDQALLHQMLDVYTEHQRWRDATGVLERLAGQQTSTSVKAKYLYAAAVIVRDNIKDQVEAAEWLRRVIEIDPTHARAFEARIDLLVAQDAHTDLSRTIRAYLKSHSKQLAPPRMVALFEMLSDAYVRLGDEKTALAAIDQAARMAEKIEEDAEERRRRQEAVIRKAILIGDDELDKAVYHAHAIIADAPMDFETYHRLVEIYLARGEKDNARVISRTLMFVHQADEAEEELAEALPGQPTDTISSQLFHDCIRHPQESSVIGEVFALVWPMIAVRQAHTLAMQGVTADRRVTVELGSSVSFARYLAYGCRIFEAPMPDLFMKEQGLGVVLDVLAAQRNGQQVMHPTVIAGRDVAAEMSEVVLRCRAGRAIAGLRPEAILASVLAEPHALAMAFWGAVWVAQGSEAVPAEHRPVAEDYGRHIVSYLSAANLDELRRLLERLTEGFDGVVWRQGIVRTMNRAGFVLSDSIEVTAQVVMRVADDHSGLSTKERIADLIEYSVSRPYLDLRRKIGLAG